MSNSDSDSEDYDSLCGGPLILADKDYAEIDALSALYSLPATSNTSFSSKAASLDENMTPPIIPALSNGLKLKMLSPFKKFRLNGRLSVTDLVAPTWCEVQFEYGLQQQRSRKLESRPSIFMTRHGKEIVVEKDTAVVNDATLKAGHAVHSILEREIHPNRVVIEARTQEELWAKKFCDMLACLQSLELCNICREFPVVGFVHGQLVAGIIDEVKRVPCREPDTSNPPSPSSVSPQAKRRRGRPKKNPDHQSSDSESSIDVATNLLNTPHPQKRYRLFLSDSKTRFSFSLPSHSATLASRLQLMLYRNLLNDLISVTVPFDFDRLWQSLHVNPTRIFSDSFLAQIFPVLGDDSNILCLKDLEQEWKIALAALDLSGKKEDIGLPVHEQLTIIYRSRANTIPMNKRRRPRSLPSSESAQLQQALLDSLQSCKHSTTDRGIPHASTTLNDQDPTSGNVKIPEIGLKTTSLATDMEGETSSNANGSTEQRDLAIGDIIGQVQFDHDETLLNSHITNVLDWWYGKREPEGVAIEEASRCNACEYISGCEWRERMAAELLNR